MALSVLDALAMLGGVARRQDLVAATSRSDVERSVRTGELVALGRGTYGSRGADAALAAAVRINGTLSNLSAALHHQWAVKQPPVLPQITVPRGRKLNPDQKRGAIILRADLDPDDIIDGVTSRDRTLVDCLRREPFDSALAVVDSAIRSGFPPGRLHALARDARGPNSVHMRSVAAHASGAAANPFESVLRAIGLDVPGLNLRPQVPIFATEFIGRPDLVDNDLRIIAEADSFAWHGDRAALRSDARRYDTFVVNGWLVLRFAWEDVMFHPDWVRWVLTEAVELRSGRRVA